MVKGTYDAIELPKVKVNMVSHLHGFILYMEELGSTIDISCILSRFFLVSQPGTATAA